MFVEDKAKGEVKELDETARLLLAAATLIEERGWVQGSYRKDGFCVMGALHMCATGTAHLGCLAVDRAAARASMAVASSIIAWNDYAGRTKEEVVAKLRAVAFSS